MNLTYWQKGAIIGFLFSILARGIIIAIYISVIFSGKLNVNSPLAKAIDSIVMFASNPVYYTFDLYSPSLSGFVVFIEIMTSVIFYTLLFALIGLLIGKK